MVTRVLCPLAVLSYLLIDAVETEVRHSSSARSSLAWTAVSNWTPDLAPANNGTATSMAQSIGASSTIDIDSRAVLRNDRRHPVCDRHLSRSDAHVSRETYHQQRPATARVRRSSRFVRWFLHHCSAAARIFWRPSRGAAIVTHLVVVR